MSSALQAALVIFDEIHYLRDKERGVVWEESIILMPKNIRFAFLSATVPNAAEFAQWIAKTHRQASLYTLVNFYSSSLNSCFVLLCYPATYLLLSYPSFTNSTNSNSIKTQALDRSTNAILASQRLLSLAFSSWIGV